LEQTTNAYVSVGSAASLKMFPNSWRE